MFNNVWKSWKRVKSPSNYTFLLSYDLNIYVLIRTTGWTVGHRERFKRITIKAQSTQCVYETMRFQRKRSSSRLPFSKRSPRSHWNARMLRQEKMQHLSFAHAQMMWETSAFSKVSVFAVHTSNVSILGSVQMRAFSIKTTSNHDLWGRN